MTQVVGTPDWQRGVVAANKLLATVGVGVFTVDVGVPTNVNRISIVGPVQGAGGTMQVLGLTSGILYPGTVIQGTDPVGPSQVYVFRVNPLLDATVRVSFPAAWGGVDWWVLTETDQSTVTVDQLEILLQANGAPEQTYGLLVMGSDNVNAYVLRTDSTGHLIVTETTLDALAQTIGAATLTKGILALGSDGTDARALKTDASGVLQVNAGSSGAPVQDIAAVLVAGGYLAMGSDGTDGRAVLTDASGHLLTIDQNLAAAIAAIGAAHPADIVQVGGNDGTNTHALRMDTSGDLKTLDINLQNALGPIASLIPSFAVLVGGSDGADLRAIKTDAGGQIIPMGPTSTTDLIAVLASSTTLLAAPGSGNNYLFGVDIGGALSAGNVKVEIGGKVIAWAPVASGVGVSIPLHGYKTNAAVTAIAGATGISAVLRYAPGP